MIRNHLKPVIFLINNDGYTIERVISDRPYNDIQPWHYHKLVDVFGGGLGLEVRTEGELEDALGKAGHNGWPRIHRNSHRAVGLSRVPSQCRSVDGKGKSARLMQDGTQRSNW